MRVLVFTPVLRGRWFDLSSKAMFGMLPLEDGGQVDYLQLMGGDTAEHPFDNITRKCNEARALVLHGGYDAMMMVEGTSSRRPTRCGGWPLWRPTWPMGW
jgi:hypothetical protein